MKTIKRSLITDATDAASRLDDMDLELAPLLRVRDVSLLSRNNATPYHAFATGGWNAYSDGLFTLRDQLIGNGDSWVYYNHKNVEGVYNERRNLIVSFCSVVKAHTTSVPQRRKKCGPVVEDLCSGDMLFPRESIPVSMPRMTGDPAFYYVMVDIDGRVELTCPVVIGQRFADYIERIYLSDGSDFNLENETLMPLDDDDAINNFAPQVIRK